MNKLKTPIPPAPPSEAEEVEEAPVPQPRKKKKPSAFSKGMVRITNGVFGIFDRNQIVHLMPFILFISLLVVGYIANSYYAERMVRDIDKTKVELKEKRAEYISIMSRLSYQSNQSEIAKLLAPYSIYESTAPPSKIFISEAVTK